MEIEIDYCRVTAVYSKPKYFSLFLQQWTFTSKYWLQFIVFVQLKTFWKTRPRSEATDYHNIGCKRAFGLSERAPSLRVLLLLLLF